MKLNYTNKDYTKNTPTHSLSDLAFILLIFLILTSMSYFEQFKSVALPKMQNIEEIETKEKLYLYIDNLGQLDIQTEMNEVFTNISLEEFSDYAISVDSVMIYADSKLPYKKIHYLLKQLEENNIKRVGFICESKK